MPQSLARLSVHLVFSTKDREPWLADSIRESLHRYMAVVLQSLGCHAMLINSVEDHVHILLDLGRTVAMSAAVEKLKTSSSKWVKTQGSQYADFGWQSGYGAFSVSASAVEEVRAYIARQREHHVKRSFRDELRSLLERNGVAYDERYLWD